MNIDSIKNYSTGSMLKHKPKYGLENQQKSVELCDKNLNRGYYGGSFTGINVAAAAGSLPPHKDGGALDKVLTLCDKHTVIAQNLVALVLAAGFRPIAIMSLPGKKDKEDKIYASGHSIASGLIGFGFSSIVMYPLGEAVSKTKKKITDVARAIELSKKPVADLAKEELDKINNLKEKYGVSDLKELENHPWFKKFKDTFSVKKLEDLESSKAFENVVKTLNMAPDVFIFGVAKAMLTIALIPPILKYVFGIEKGKKKEVQQPNLTSQTMIKPEMTKFAGGINKTEKVSDISTQGGAK
ncbi:hypothetical protein HDR58_02995 [bacterium]|nr:hypothetical protein [bacterium]